MKTENEPLSTQDSLQIIVTMIQQAKGNVQRDSFYFLLWGWVIALANIGHYVILKFTAYPRPYIVWLVAIPAYAVTLIYGYRQGKKQISRTHLDKVSAILWIGFGVSVPVIILFGERINYNINPIILLMAALPTFISGILINFRPLLIGGVLFWVASIVSFMVPYEFQYPLMAITIILGYLIPGYILKKSK